MTHSFRMLALQLALQPTISALGVGHSILSTIYDTFGVGA